MIGFSVYRTASSVRELADPSYFKKKKDNHSKNHSLFCEDKESAQTEVARCLETEHRSARS